MSWNGELGQGHMENDTSKGNLLRKNSAKHGSEGENPEKVDATSRRHACGFMVLFLSICPPWEVPLGLTLYHSIQPLPELQHWFKYRQVTHSGSKRHSQSGTFWERKAPVSMCTSEGDAADVFPG